MIMAGKPTTFITLTVNPAIGASPAARARLLARAWPKVVKRICKRWGVDHVPYICVFEATKRGEPHLHLLARLRYIPQRWLSKQLRELIQAPIVDIRKVKSQKDAAYYISKYLGKDPHRFTSCKRYWSTRDWGLPTPEDEPEDSIWEDRWYVVNNTLPGLRRRWAAMGYDTAMEGKMLIAMRPAMPGGP